VHTYDLLPCMHVWMLNELVDAGGWLAFIGIFAVSEVFVALAAATAGAVLRAAHQEVTSTRFYTFVRRSGLWRIWVTFLRSVGNRRLFQHWSRYARILKPVAVWGSLAVLCGAATGLLLPTIVWLLLPRSYESGLLGEGLLWTGGIAAALMAVLGTGLWLRGLSYMALAGQGAKLPYLSSHDLSLDVRNNLALNIFWYARLSWAPILGAAYPWLFIVVTAYVVNTNPSAAHRDAAKPPSSLASTIIFIVVLALTIIVPLAAVRPIRRRIISWKISGELYLLIHPSDGTGQGSRDYPFSFLIVDPLRRQRNRLVRVALDLSYAARVFDGRQPRNLGPHPISTILRAVSRYIRQFLASQQSLQESIPNDLMDILSMTLVLLCQSKPSEVYQHLAQQVTAFDQNGAPAVDLENGAQSKIVTFSSRATAGLRGAASLIVALATSIAIIIVCVLYIRHRIDMNGVLRYLP
jgi:hypothetical protein